MFNAKLSTQKNKNITLMKYKAGFGVKIKMLIMQFISISALSMDRVVTNDSNQACFILIEAGF
ncbi:hypothetical protein BMR11_05415, partial [Methylococcaceae bacterium CS5]